MNTTDETNIAEPKNESQIPAEIPVQDKITAISSSAPLDLQRAENFLQAAESFAQSELSLIHETVQGKEVEPNNSFKQEGQWLYGIDNLSKNNPTAKDKIFLQLDRALQNTDEKDTTAMLDKLLTPDTVGEQVRGGDLLAAYDGLSHRVKSLQEKHGKSYMTDDLKSFQNKKDVLGKYLAKKGYDLNDDAINSRLDKFKTASEKYHNGIEPNFASDKFNRLARRAASLEVYSPDEGTQDLASVQEHLQKYPQDETELRKVMVQECGLNMSWDTFVAWRREAREAEKNGVTEAMLMLQGSKDNDVYKATETATNLGIKQIVDIIRTPAEDTIDNVDTTTVIVSDEELKKLIENPNNAFTVESYNDGETIIKLNATELNKKMIITSKRTIVR